MSAFELVRMLLIHRQSMLALRKLAAFSFANAMSSCSILRCGVGWAAWAVSLRKLCHGPHGFHSWRISNRRLRDFGRYSNVAPAVCAPDRSHSLSKRIKFIVRGGP